VLHKSIWNNHCQLAGEISMRVLLSESSLYKPLYPYFAVALEDLSRTRQWQFRFVDEADFFPSRRSLPRRALEKFLGQSWRGHCLYNRRLIEVARTFRPDVVLVVSGKFVSPTTLNLIKRQTGAVLVNYATDDPYNPIVSTRYFRKSIREFDIYITPKKALVEDIKAATCARAVRLPFAYRPEIHFKEPPEADDEKRRFACEVIFIGSCDHDRPAFFRPLLQNHPSLRLSIYGANGWERYHFLRPYIRGVVWGRDFRLALSGARIALNFIRHTNRDDHSERAFQIAACGTFMLSERTDEQVELFAENREAAYFGSAEELSDKVGYYLQHDSEREAIAAAGHRRVLADGHTCKNRLLQILSIASEECCEQGLHAGLNATG
jgi:spore maturation protein CgeB